LAAEQRGTVIDDTVQDSVGWVAPSGQRKTAQLPRVIFSR